MHKKFKILFCLLFFVLLYLLFLCKPSFGFSVSYTNNNNVTTSKTFYNLKYDTDLGLNANENWYYLLFTSSSKDDNLVSWVANNDMTLRSDALYYLILFPKNKIKSDDRYTQPVSFARNTFQEREASITDTYFNLYRLSVRFDSNDGASKAYDYFKHCHYLVYDGSQWITAGNTDYMFKSFITDSPLHINQNLWRYKNSPNTWDIALTTNTENYGENPGVFGAINFYNATYNGGYYNFDNYNTFDFFSTKPFIGRRDSNNPNLYVNCNLILAGNTNENIPDIGWNNLFTSQDVPSGDEPGGGGTTPEVNEHELTRNTIIEQSQAIQDKQQSTTDAVNNLNNNIMNPHTDTYNGSDLPQDNFQDGSTDLTGSFNLIKSMFDRGQEVLVIDLQLPNNKHYEFRLEKDMIRNMLANNTYGNLFLTFWQAIATFIMLMPCISIIKNIVSNIKSFSITGSSVSTNEPVSYFINKFLG